MTETSDPRLRRIGWLLTPLLVWAAAFVGAWVGALIATRTGGRWGGLPLMIGGAAGLVIGTVVAWALVLRPRRSRPPDGTS